MRDLPRHLTDVECEVVKEQVDAVANTLSVLLLLWMFGNPDSSPRRGVKW